MLHSGLRNAALSVVLCSLPAAAIAQVDVKAEARTHFDRGLVLAKGLAYAEAVAEFNTAYQLSPNYAVLFNLGQAYVGMGQPVYAVDVLKRYLTDGGKEVPAARRRQVEADITQQERRIATVTVRAPYSGVAIRLDGVEVGKSPLPEPVRVAAGAHVFAASLPGYRPWEQRLELAGKEQRLIEMAFEPVAAPVHAAAPTSPVSGAVAPAPGQAASATVAPTATAAANPAVVGPGPAPAAETTAPAVPPSTPTAGSKRLPAYVVGGLGLASLAVGGVFGIRAITQMNDSDKECPKDVCSQRGVDLANRAKTSALIADITIGAGLVGVAVATYLFVRSPKATEPAPGTLASSIQVAPAVGPNLAGVALGGSW